MKSTSAAQKKLLDAQRIDNAITRAVHRRGTLPEIAALASLTTDRDAVRGGLARDLGVFEDAKTELGRLESDVQVVEARIARDNALIAQSQSPVAVAGLQSELESLTLRRGILEDAQLEAMQVVETAETALRASQQAEAELSSQINTVNASREESLEVIAEEVSVLENERANLLIGAEEPLIALYERIRAKNIVGAALFRAGTCGACNIALTGNELALVRSAELDEVLQCPECTAIMVRTEESGLW